MSDFDSHEFWKTAYSVCTVREIEALHHKAKGYGHRRIARMLGITPAAVRDRLDSAHRKIRQRRAA